MCLAICRPRYHHASWTGKKTNSCHFDGNYLKRFIAIKIWKIPRLEICIKSTCYGNKKLLYAHNSSCQGSRVIYYIRRKIPRCKIYWCFFLTFNRLLGIEIRTCHSPLFTWQITSHIYRNISILYISLSCRVCWCVTVYKELNVNIDEEFKLENATAKYNTYRAYYLLSNDGLVMMVISKTYELEKYFLYSIIHWQGMSHQFHRLSERISVRLFVVPPPPQPVKKVFYKRDI